MQRWICAPGTPSAHKKYDWTLFLLGAIYKFRSHLHHSVTTLILHCKVSRLARLTSHMTLSDTTNYYSSRPHRFPRKYKSAESFWRFLVVGFLFFNYAKEGFSFFLFHFLPLEIFFIKNINSRNILIAVTGFWGCDSTCGNLQKREQLDV